MIQVAHQAGAYPGFCSMKPLGVFLPPPPPPLDGMLVHHRVTRSAHLHTWLARGTVRIKGLTQEHNTTGHKITDGHWTMSGQDDYFSRQNLGLAVILTDHDAVFKQLTRKKIIWKI